jgi:hypothetical protein
MKEGLLVRCVEFIEARPWRFAVVLAAHTTLVGALLAAAVAGSH